LTLASPSLNLPIVPRHTRLRVAASLVASLAILLGSASPTLGWTVSYVDEPRMAATTPWWAHDTDASGRDHFVFASPVTNSLHYRTHLGGWSATERITQHGPRYVDSPLSMDVTPAGDVYILFSRHDNESFESTSALFWLTNESGDWVQRRAEAAAHLAKVHHDGGGGIAVASGRVSFAYVVYLAGVDRSELYVRTIQPSGASSTRLLMSEGFFSSTDLAVDGNGAIHVASRVHTFAGQEDLRYFTNRTGTWSAKWLERTSVQAYGVAIAVSPGGIAHAAVGLCPQGCGMGVDVAYLSNASGTWREEARWPVGLLRLLDIAYAGGGAVHLAWGYLPEEPYTDAIRYRTNRTGTWTTKTWFHGPLSSTDIQHTSEPFVRSVNGSPHVVYLLAQDCCEGDYWTRIYVRTN
jgi:hypothetical protein